MADRFAAPHGLRDRHVQRVAAIFVLARIPAAAIWLSIVLDVSTASGSYTRAGAAVAAYGIGVALIAPVAGRLADRFGARPVLLLGVVVQLPALLLLSALAASAGPALLLPALLAGAAQPPLVPCMRAAWRTLVPDGDARRPCLAFDAVLGETVDLASPLIAVALNIAAGDRGSLPIVAVAAAVALIAFAAVVPSTPRQAGTPPVGTVLGRPVLAVLGVILVLTAGLGAVEIAVIAVADAAGERSAAGTLLAVFAGASIVGGVLHARRRSRVAPTVELGLLLVPLSLGLLAAAATADDLWLTGAMLALAGLAVAPLVTVLLGMVELVARPGAETVTFTFATTANFLGVAAGSALAGIAVDATRPGALMAAGTRGLLVAAVFCVLSLVLVIGVRRVLPRELPVADPHVDGLVRELEVLWESTRRAGVRNDRLRGELARLGQGRPLAVVREGVEDPSV